mmetsp:Transcript_10199/g.41315  ORF Transcript_10199/g.41315 Transcript_10199/m.41315 type:complete len:270 (+) Transcript_10199:220-1029(+)
MLNMFLTMASGVVLPFLAAAEGPPLPSRSALIGPWRSFDTMPRDSRSTASISRCDSEASLALARFISWSRTSSAFFWSLAMAGTAPSESSQPRNAARSDLSSFSASKISRCRLAVFLATTALSESTSYATTFASPSHAGSTLRGTEMSTSMRGVARSARSSWRTTYDSDEVDVNTTSASFISSSTRALSPSVATTVMSMPCEALNSSAISRARRSERFKRRHSVTPCEAMWTRRSLVILPAPTMATRDEASVDGRPGSTPAASASLASS